MSPARKDKVATVILAAGYSSRMGCFKPMLPLGGSSALERIINAARSAGSAGIYVVTGHNDTVLAATLEQMKVRQIHNPTFDTGMYSSIAAGVSGLASDVDACLILPVDIPLVRKATLERLIAHHPAKQTVVLYPTFRGQRGHPPRIQRALFPKIIEAQAASDNGGLKHLLEQYAQQAEQIAVFDQCILFDMDTPDDYVRLCALAENQEIPSVEECEAILAERKVDDHVLRHSYQVANVARCLSQALITRGIKLNQGRILAAALLHDMSRSEPHHAQAGAAAIEALGFPDLAPLIASHMDLQYCAEIPDDAAIVYLADKLVKEDQLVSLQTRFQLAFERFSQQPKALQGAKQRYDAACAIADSITRITGMSLNELLSTIGK